MDHLQEWVEAKALALPYDEELTVILGKLKKTDLKRIVDFHGLKGTSSLNKSGLNDRIVEATGDSERLSYLLYGMDDAMLKDFKRLNENDFVQVKNLKTAAAIPLGELGYLFPLQKEGETVLVMAEPAKAAYEGIDEKEVRMTRKRLARVYHYLKAMVNMMGICSLKYVAEVYNRYEETEVSPEDVLHSLICMMTFHEEVESFGPLAVHPALVADDSEEAVLALLKEQEGRELYFPALEEINAYGEDEVVWSRELEAVAAHLSASGVEDGAELAMEMAAAFPYGFSMKGAMLPLEMRGIGLPDFEATQKLAGLLMAAYNHSRVWEIGGHRPDDLAPSALKNIVVPSFAPIRSVKIGRNDPCPCGSGKKHKRCCG